jgi:AraC family transcriptional regulator of arabinose operon
MDQRVQIALALMTEELRRELSSDVLAQSVNLSPSRFRHIFKAEVGTSPARHLRALRMERAREMLETSLLGVKQIMTSLGIGDRSHFDREFKKAYGLTPVRYRAAYPLVRLQKHAGGVQ